jgi:GNAT superfamily N-acetyltransferase
MGLRDQIVRGDSRAIVDRFAAVGDALFADDPHPAAPRAARTLPLLDREHPSRRHCELELVLADGPDGRGRVAAIVNPRLVEDGAAVGQVGLFACDERTDTARWLLEAACTWLDRRGCKVVRGPMVFSTWHDYRLVTRAETPDHIPGEPYHPRWYPSLFEAAGFTASATYSSNWLGEVGDNIDKFAGRARRARDEGYQVRNLSPRDLDALYGVATAAFAGAWMYSPIERDEFAALYTPAQAERVAPYSYLGLAPDGEPIGFMYDFPLPIGGVLASVCKTVAVHPAHRASGIYAAMMHAWFTAQREAGVRASIGALMHNDGSPALMGWAKAETLLKEYRLYELRL